MDGGEDAAFGEFAVEADFHVAGAFEFLEDDVVEAGFGFDEGGGEDGEGAAVFDVAGGSEEFAGFLEGYWGDAAGADGAALHGGVVATGEACEGVEEEDDVFAEFDHALGAGDDEVRDLGVAFGWFVEGGGVNGCVNGFLEVGDFFGAFVEEEDDEFDAGVVGFDGFGDLFEEDGFAAARGGDDEAALAFSEGGDEVDDADAEVFRAGTFEVDAAVGEHRCELVEVGGFAPLGGGGAFDFEDFGGGEVFVALDGLADFDFEELAVADFGIGEGLSADVDVVLGGAEGALGVADHGEVFLAEFDDALAGDVGAVGEVEADDFVDELGFGDAALDFAGDFGGDRLEFGEGFFAEFVEVDVLGDGEGSWFRCGGDGVGSGLKGGGAGGSRFLR